MRGLRSAAVVVGLGVLGVAVGCGLAGKARVAESDEGSQPMAQAPGEPPKAIPAQMPPNTVMLSAMMRELSAQPGFTEKFLAEIQGGAKKAGAALLTPELVHFLRDMILGKNWEGLDRFPGWTMRQINPTVRVVGHVAGKDSKVDNMATAGGAPSGPTSAEGRKAALAYLDLGEYTAEGGGTVSLDQPAQGKPFNTAEYVSAIGAGVTRGDGPNPERARHHAESQRLADVLNRLSLSGQGNIAPLEVEFAGKTVSTPQDLMAAIAGSGHAVVVADSRYFANFGHLHYNGQDVMMPFWVNPLIVVPGTKRPLLVPVSHAEYEWFITGPKLNAEVSFYFGIDGKAEFRTMDQLDQAWVMSRHAREYRGADALEVTRLAGLMVQTYMHEHEARPKLPFGGYYALGVCQDVVAAIELKMTGTTTLFPNTADAALFNDARDAEINALIRQIPKDRAGRLPEVERIFGSLPVGDSDAELATITVPGLGADLIAVHNAWTAGDLRRIRPRWEVWSRRGAAVLGVAIGFGVAWWVRRRSRRR